MQHKTCRTISLLINSIIGIKINRYTMLLKIITRRSVSPFPVSHRPNNKQNMAFLLEIDVTFSSLFSANMNIIPAVSS